MHPVSSIMQAPKTSTESSTVTFSSKVPHGGGVAWKTVTFTISVQKSFSSSAETSTAQMVGAPMRPSVGSRRSTTTPVNSTVTISSTISSSFISSANPIPTDNRNATNTIKRLLYIA